MIYLDTNVLVRFFTNDIPEQARLAKTLLESPKILRIVDVVFPELEYVLRYVYNADRSSVFSSYKFLSSQKNIHVSTLAKKAIFLYEKTTLEMTDCFIFVSTQGQSLASFDKKLLHIEGIRSYWK